MLVLATILFILLSPGLVLTLPPGSKGLLGSEETSNLAILIHTALFYTVLKLTHDGTFPFSYLQDAETSITGSNF
jgi:hypothetical protein